MNKIDPDFAWGPRDQLYRNSFDYMFSLDAEFEMCVHPGSSIKVPVRALKSQHDWNTFHVLGREFVRTPTGIQTEVPLARLVYGSLGVAIEDRATTSVNGSMLFETDTPDRLSMRYRGVLNLRGGTIALSSKPQQGIAGPEGTIFIASRQDIANPKYRWMVINQLVGIGRVKTRGDKGNWILTIDYDLYIAS